MDTLAALATVGGVVATGLSGVVILLVQKTTREAIDKRVTPVFDKLLKQESDLNLRVSSLETKTQVLYSEFNGLVRAIDASKEELKALTEARFESLEALINAKK